MRNSRQILATIFGIGSILWTAGCGTDAEPAEPTSDFEMPAAAGLDSLERLPPEEIYGVSPADNLWSPRFELELRGLPQGWNGARLAILSDFQIGLWDENEEVAARAVQRVVAAQPDLVVLLGDFLASGEDVAPLQAILAPLRGHRTVAVLGDRDIRSDSLEARVTRVLQGLGVSILRNSVIQVERGGGTLNIGGLDPELLTASIGEQQWVVGTLGDPEPVPLLLTHAPGLAARAPAGRYEVVVGGHTFCGSVEIPGTPRLSWLATEAFPNASVEVSDHLFRVQDATVLVTCGLGYGFVPLRFGAAPEVPILTLVRVAPAAPEPTNSAAVDSLP